ncbi:MAG: hypothetical protein IPJ34_35270 [Myxococcales bacterium]|nr:hypothetical protein [Myxococcales bacterium]
MAPAAPAAPPLSPPLSPPRAPSRAPPRAPTATPTRASWGGARVGAGRPRKKGSESHRRRPCAVAGQPQHVTFRVAKGVWNLRAERCFRLLRAAFVAVRRHGFRVVHYSVQGNHAHLVVEVANHRAFAAGLRALSAHVTHALHRVMGRGGRVLAGRIHARALRTPSEVRTALRYVLRNRTHHLPAEVHLDECSTAPWFGDWAALGLAAPRAGRAPVHAPTPPRAPGSSARGIVNPSPLGASSPPRPADSRRTR